MVRTTSSCARCFHGLAGGRLGWAVAKMAARIECDGNVVAFVGLSVGRKRMLSVEEFTALLPEILAAADAPVAEIDFDPAEINFDVLDVPPVDNSLSSPEPKLTSPLPPVSGTQSILIRVPKRVIRAFQTEAGRTGGRYQTLMNRTLRVAADDFV